MKKGSHPNSIKNLELGAISRKSRKRRHCYTILPETHEFLLSRRNASSMLDELVGKHLRGELVPVEREQFLLRENQHLKDKLKALTEDYLVLEERLKALEGRKV